MERGIPLPSIVQRSAAQVSRALLLAVGGVFARRNSTLQVCSSLETCHVKARRIKTETGIRKQSPRASEISTEYVEGGEGGIGLGRAANTSWRGREQAVLKRRPDLSSSCPPRARPRPAAGIYVIVGPGEDRGSI